jgi:hypothetical protein
MIGENSAINRHSVFVRYPFLTEGIPLFKLLCESVSYAFLQTYGASLVAKHSSSSVWGFEKVTKLIANVTTNSKILTHKT